MGWEWGAGKETGLAGQQKSTGQKPCPGSRGRRELRKRRTQHQRPKSLLVPEHLIHTWLTFSIIFTLNVAVGRFPSGSVILFAACDSHLSRLTGMSLLTLLEKVTALNLALFANVSWDAVCSLHWVFKNICRDIPFLLPLPHTRQALLPHPLLPWEARASARPPLCSPPIWGLYQPLILLW